MRCHVWISVWSIKWLAPVRCPWWPRSAASPWSPGLCCGLNPLWSTSQNLSLFKKKINCKFWVPFHIG
ncbi:hypothetical protein PR003_g17531 [Phytophthora rubi]|uniref:Secreted protein n=1 Tax=Phytophthora rubi TaxID=129364 RepID=A0A6A4EM33_9STRA|nr:hypothetical protein PR002_g16820 [Phytophthora rubi]KAE9321212.1 hypothetical protein PR003_g17531 [Phytophthora rubi]